MQQLRSIQVLRAFAACAVVAVHASNRAQELSGPSSLTAIATNIGHAGVDLFFLISGFLMAYLHAEQFGRGRSGAFFGKRLARIVPLYWLLSAFGLSLAFLAPHLFSAARTISPGWLLGNFLFIMPWPQPNGVMEHVLVVGWTLDYEMWFYVLFALAMIWRRGLLFLSAFLIACAFAGFLLKPAHPWPALLTSGMLLEFLAGIGIAVAFRLSLPRSVGFALLLLGLVLLALSVDVTGPRQWKWGIPCAFILAGTLWARFRSESLAARALSTVGDASYSIYLSQVFTLPAIAIVARLTHLNSLPTNALMFVLWICACAAGVACWIMVERPIGRWLRTAREPKGVPAAV